MEMNALIASATATLLAVAWKIIGALVLWLVGRWLIGFAVRLLHRTLSGQLMDPDPLPVSERGLSVLLNVVLIVAILGFFGVETTTFAALLAAGGVAIGVAWGGLLSNFAAGAFPYSSGRSRSATSSPSVVSPAPLNRSGCLALSSTRLITW